MADNKPTANFYDMLGGVNQKASEYSVNRAQFLDIRNMDFDVPNALQKRPGSTQAITVGTSGPINSVFEFIKLDGTSFVVAGSDTAMFYLAGAAYTLLDTGWNNGQPANMLTFVNKLWIANGQKYSWWTGSTLLSAFLPTPPGPLEIDRNQGFQNGASWFLVGGATHITWQSAVTYTVRGVYVAYSYLRNDGYVGPANFLKDAKNVVADYNVASSGSEFFNTLTYLAGYTALGNHGITAISVWVAADTVTDTSAADPTVGNAQAGNMGYAIGGQHNKFMSVTLRPNADLSRFQLYTTIPTSTLFAKSNVYDQYTLGAGTTMWCATFTTFTHASFTIVAPANIGFSGMAYDFLQTYTPKYIEVNQNSMFMAGFSNAPSVVWFSDLGEPESVQVENFFEVRTNDGDRLYGQKAYNNYILLFKERSFHKVVGNSSDNYQLVQLSGDYGCLSDKSIVEYDEKLVWIDRKGVMQFDGAGWRIISGPVEDTFRRMNINSAKENACAAHWPDRNQIWFGIPLDNSTQNNTTVVWDYLIDAWTFFDGFSPSSFALVRGTQARPVVWRGNYSGMIALHGSSFYGDGGLGITCLARPHWDKWQGEHSTNIWRRLFLDMATATGLTGTVTGKVFSNYDGTTVQATYAMYQNQFQTRAEMGVVGKAVTTEWAHFSASLPLLINGYSWSKRTLRNV